MRAFIGNFEFEHQLASPGFTPSLPLQRLNAEFATSWLAIADEGDLLWTPEPIEPEFWDHCHALGLPRLTTVARLEDLPVDAIWTPWGWTSPLIDQATRRGQPVADSQIIRQANSRRYSAELEEKWHVGLPGSMALSDASALDAAIAYLCEPASRWVIKAEFGMSGRERLLGAGSPTEPQRSWINRRLRADGVVFFEPWVNRVAEAGLLFDLMEQGVVLVGIAEMLPMTQGQYAGSIFHADRNQHDWSSALKIATRAAEHLHAAGYRGPLGIDAMWYRDEAGELRCRPLQDINARWTMGRLALGWRRRFPEITFGYLWQGSRTAWDRGDHLAAARERGYLDGQCRVICTTPESIGARTTQHVAAVVSIP